MANREKPKQSPEMSEIVSETVADVVTGDSLQTEAVRTPNIVIDGVEHDATNLSDPVKSAIASLKFAAAKLMALQNELAICQTAHFAYVKGLKAELEGKAS